MIRHSSLILQYAPRWFFPYSPKSSKSLAQKTENADSFEGDSSFRVLGLTFALGLAFGLIPCSSLDNVLKVLFLIRS